MARTPRRTPSGKRAAKRPIETYEHKGKQRVNNPPVGLVTPETDPDVGQTKKTYAYDPHLDPELAFDSQAVRGELAGVIDDGLAAETLEDAKAALKTLKKAQEPYLNWAGKAEGTSFEVPTVSLHVHERIDPRTIIEAVRRRNGDGAMQASFFGQLEENPPIREAIDFYKHPHGWSNRMIAGDSLLVMNSLLEKEGMAGKVQMVYIDPPYGIKYGSNFQPFVNRRDVTDGRDEDLTAEPEQIRAFRDTWELGIHSYLTYLRDRLQLAHKLLTDSGSVFVQINGENLQFVRAVIDDVFGTENFLGVISFKKTGYQASALLPSNFDYLCWYAREKKNVKFRQLNIPKLDTGAFVGQDLWVEEPGGNRRRLTRDEHANLATLPSELRLFRHRLPEGSGAAGNTEPFEFDGALRKPKPGKHWSTTPDGLVRLAAARRLMMVGNTLRFVNFLDDFPVTPVTTNWTDTVVSGFSDPQRYVVETSPKVVERCVLMCTDPGDIVFDPTCGSGTTSFVAEQWGRRWITCDTSRVALTLAKQRLMTALFDYYELAHPDEGVGSGFKYKTVPHVMLKSIANNEPPAQETLYDQPFLDNKRKRVSGPMTVEAVPAPMVTSVEEVLESAPQPADASIARSGETLRQGEWRDELLRTGIRGKAGQFIRFARLEPLPGCRWLHADGETRPSDEGADSVREEPAAYLAERVVVSFGPEHAPLEQRQVAQAIEEAQTLVPRPKLIVFAAFQFDPEAAKDIDETNWPGVVLLKAQMNADLLTADLKKKRASNESFWLVGQPDVQVERSADDETKYVVSVHGFDYYNTKTGDLESGGTDKIAVWLLDTDYDGRSLYPRQVFFPMAGANQGWARLARNLKAEIDEDLIETYRGTVSLPFEAGQHGRIAVKIVDDRGIESLKLLDLN